MMASLSCDDLGNIHSLTACLKLTFYGEQNCLFMSRPKVRELDYALLNRQEQFCGENICIYMYIPFF